MVFNEEQVPFTPKIRNNPYFKERLATLQLKQNSRLPVIAQTSRLHQGSEDALHYLHTLIAIH